MVASARAGDADVIFEADDKAYTTLLPPENLK